MDNQRDTNLIEQMLTLVSMQEDGSFIETKVSESARQVKEFIDEIPGGFLIYHADANERLIFANKELLRIFKCETFAEFKELTGNSFKGIVYHEDLEEVEKSIIQQISSSQDCLDYVEYRIKAKDGTIRWVEDYGHFIKSESIGNIFYVFITDATEKINRRQQEHMQRLEVIEGLSVNYDSILYVSLEKDTVLPYRLSNRLTIQFNTQLQERKYSTFVEDYVNTWVHADDKQLIREKLSVGYIKKSLKEDKTYYINYKCEQNGETQYLQARLVNVTHNDGVSQVVIGIRNIDKEVLQEMKQKKFLEDALNTAKLSEIAKNTFLSNMSHDLRTPLNAIFGYSSLAKKNLKDEALARSYIDKIESAGRSILQLVDRVLELSYMESQDYRVDEKKCNLHDLVQDVFRTAMPSATEKDISISLHSSALKHGDVYADKEKLKQILDRIVGNAVKYTKNGGSINITVTEQNAASKEFSTFRFAVQDNGIGISKEFLPKIFEAFERENNTTFSGVFGSGLGLTIAKRMAESMDGNIEVQSTHGKGSTFTVTLSLRLQDIDEADAADEEKLLKYLNGKKILLVEDNEINLEIETEMLQDLGLVIEPAENGKIAVDKLSAATPDEYLFVLMDIQMPVMDGRQAAESIRKLNSPAASVPIIALSANAFENDKRLSLEAGMDDHINKPLDIPVLLKSLAKILKK